MPRPPKKQYDLLAAVAKGARVELDGMFSKTPEGGDPPSPGALVTISKRKDSSQGICPSTKTHEEMASLIAGRLYLRAFKSIQQRAIQTHLLPPVPAKTELACSYRSGLYRFKSPYCKLMGDERKALVDRNKQAPEQEAFIGVFKEPHTEGLSPFDYSDLEADDFKNCHYHVILWTPGGTGVYPSLGASLKSVGISADVRVPVDPTAGDKNLENMMDYVCVPRLNKFILDRAPFMSQGFPLRLQIQEKRRIAYGKLRKPSTPEEVMGHICARTDVTNPEALQDLCDSSQQKIAETQGKKKSNFIGALLPLNRLSLYFTNTRMKPLEQVAEFIKRRDRVRFRDSIGQGFSYYFDAALDAPCTCCSGKKKLSEFLHDTLKRQTKLSAHCPRDPKKILSIWVDHMYFEDFKDRHCVLYITGKPKTGKTSLSSAVVSIYPKFFILQPKWDDSKPFSHVESHHSCFDLNDIRLSKGQGWAYQGVKRLTHRANCLTSCHIS